MYASVFFLALLGLAAASPLESHTTAKDCPKGNCYTCETNGVINVLDCTSIASGNKISLPLDLSVLKRDNEIEKRCEVGCGKKEKACCVTNGLLNIVTCSSILSGNSITVSATGVTGILPAKLC